MHTPSDPTYIKNLVKRSLDTTSNKEELTSEIANLTPEDTQVYTIMLLEHMTYLKKYQQRVLTGHKPGQIYYNEKYAISTRDILDTLLKNPSKDILIDSTIIGCTSETLLSRIQQSWSYIIDFLDTPDKKYVGLRGMIKCIREQNRYVRFSWKFTKPELGTGSPTKLTAIEAPRLIDQQYADMVVAAKKQKLNISWQQQVNNFISDSSVGEILDIKDLRLSEEEMEAVKNLVDQVSFNFVLARLNSGTIKILNNPEAAVAIKQAEQEAAERIARLSSGAVEETNTTGELPDEY